jgi:hypothetical protein
LTNSIIQSGLAYDLQFKVKPHTGFPLDCLPDFAD